MFEELSIKDKTRNLIEIRVGNEIIDLSRVIGYSIIRDDNRKIYLKLKTIDGRDTVIETKKANIEIDFSEDQVNIFK